MSGARLSKLFLKSKISKEITYNFGFAGLLLVTLLNKKDRLP